MPCKTEAGGRMTNDSRTIETLTLSASRFQHPAFAILLSRFRSRFEESHREG